MFCIPENILVQQCQTAYFAVSQYHVVARKLSLGEESSDAMHRAHCFRELHQSRCHGRLVIRSLGEDGEGEAGAKVA